MGYSDRTLKRLSVRSMNQCAMPNCTSPLLIGETIVGDICHIRARRKNGPRFDPNLKTLAERNDYWNLLLLCKTCHTIIDSEKETYTVDYLTEIKARQDLGGGFEMDSTLRTLAESLIAACKPKRRTTASAKDNGMAVAVGGDNHGTITLNQAPKKQAKPNKFPANSIGADANMSGYIEYLYEKALIYWKNVDSMPPGRLGKKIKTEFRLGTNRTRLHLPVERFEDLARFIIDQMLAPSPVGKSHRKKGTKLCSSFDEFRSGSKRK